MHINSLLAWEEAKDLLNERCQRILRVIERYPDSTDRDVMQELEWNDMNMVRPRITELIKKGMLRETGSMQCAVTGRRCRTLGKPQFDHPEQMKLFGL